MAENEAKPTFSLIGRNKQSDVTYRKGLDRQDTPSFLHVSLIETEIRLYGITKTGPDCRKNHCRKGKGGKTPNKNENKCADFRP